MTLRVLLDERFRPAGHRLGILMLSSASADDVAAAGQALAAHGLHPDRRLARVLPRIGEDRHRPEDVVDFLHRYGHEYAVAWLPADALGDRAGIAAAAEAEGCIVGWAAA